MGFCSLIIWDRNLRLRLKPSMFKDKIFSDCHKDDCTGGEDGADDWMVVSTGVGSSA